MPPPLVFRTGLDRYALFPIRHTNLWEEYKKAEASFWTAEEIDLGGDRFNELHENEKLFIEKTLAYFAWADGVVQENLMSNFCNDVPLAEARTFFAFQSAMEGIHAETYGLLIHTYIPKERQREVFYSMQDMPCMKRKADWIQTWMDPATASFAERCVAFSCVEGIFFCGAFASIFWLKKQSRVQMPGLTFSNELISRDESLHTLFACALYSMMPAHDATLTKDELAELVARMDEPPPAPRAGVSVAALRERGADALSDAFESEEDRARVRLELLNSVRLPPERVQEIVRSAIDVEESFIEDALPIKLIDMSAESLTTYMHFVADRLLDNLGVPKVYGAQNPWEWMELISLQGKTNFFEKRVSEYQKAGVLTGGDKTFTTEEDF